MLVTVSASMISGEITLQDSNGNSLLSYTPAKSYNSVVISCPKLTSGETYTLLAGDTTTTVTLDSLVKSVKNKVCVYRTLSRPCGDTASSLTPQGAHLCRLTCSNCQVPAWYQYSVLLLYALLRPA